MFKKLVAVSVVLTVALNAMALTQTFEGADPITGGWWLGGGAAGVVTTSNHTAGGTSAVTLNSGSAWYTFSEAQSVVSVEFWFKNTGTDVYAGNYEKIELCARNDQGSLVSQTWFRPYAIREYVAGGYTPGLPGSENKVVAGQWNKVVAEFDCTAGTYSINVNDGAYTWSTNFVASNIFSFAWDYPEKTRPSEYYLDDITITTVPEPMTMSLLGLGSLLFVRRK